VILKQSQVFCVECTNGDIHLILKDLEIGVCATYGENFDEAAAIKKIMKEEAIKPLFLMRNE
jgi:hypothetical protein